MPYKDILLLVQYFFGAIIVGLSGEGGGGRVQSQIVWYAYLWVLPQDNLEI